MLGQVLPQVLPQVPQVGGGRRLVLRHDGGEQPHAVRTIEVVESDDRRLAHRRVAGEQGLDLPGLDPEAADLDLLVDAAEELDAAVRQVARQVARAIEPRPGLTAVWIGHEALGGQVRPPEIAPCQARAAQAQLARRAGRRRPAGIVHDHRPHVSERPAQRHRGAAARLLRPHPVGQHADRALRRAVVVEHRAAAGQRPDLVGQRPGQRLAAEDQPLPRQHRRGLRRRGEERPQVRGHDLQAVDAPAAQVLPERHRVRRLRGG